MKMVRSFPLSPSIRRACALLNPERTELLDIEDLELIQRAAQALRERKEDDAAQTPPVPHRVDRETHDSIGAKLAQLAKVGTRATGRFYGC